MKTKDKVVDLLVRFIMKSDAWGPFWVIVGGLCAGLLIAILEG